jgi:ATP-dependent helicase/nuclease subunit B
MRASRPRVFTIPPGRSFLETLASAVLDGQLPEPGSAPRGPFDLADVTIILPTRRSAKGLQEAFLAVAPGRSLLLPTIRPIGQTDEDAGLMEALSGPARFLGLDGSAAEDLPAAVPPLERRLALTQMVLAWAARTERPVTPAQASALAKELAGLMDMVETEKATLDGLADVVPDAHSEHWRQTLDFLGIITQVWPSYLTARGLSSPAARRNRLIESEALRLQTAPPKGPVIVAGVTGSVPATAALMKVVANLEQGAVVLPGLDQLLDAAGWDAIRPPVGQAHPEHPQFGFSKLLSELGLTRADVRVLAGAEPEPRVVARARLISEAMRPAATTDTWHVFAQDPDNQRTTKAALDGVCLLEAPSGQDEADAVALILRQAAEDPRKTAALITPDRNLGRRVAILLEEWGLMVDDSAGRPLAKTPPGVFLDHVAETIHSDFAPGPLMALLKHPLARLGLPVGQVRRSVRALELLAFRQSYIGTGLKGITRALDNAEQEALDETFRPRAVRRLRAEDRTGAREILDKLRIAFAPMAPLWQSFEPQSLKTLAQAHIACAEVVAADPLGEARSLWQGEDGEAAALFLARLTEETAPSIDLRPTDYADFYRSLLAGDAVRPSVALHPRLFIWGPYESRLQQPDIVILGGLNEGIWPQTADPGAWLNRGMLKAVGLPAPEEKIGFLAHDFTQALGAPEIYLTRSNKIDGAPTVPSRWLLRLRALLGGLGLEAELQPPPHMPWLTWAARRNATGEVVPIRRPAPCPPVPLRPRKMSVTAIETWLANPYAIYARSILQLDELPALTDTPGANLRGSFIHQALHRFVKEHPTALPADIEGQLMALLDEIMADHAAHPRVAAFWRPRFRRFAAWFGETEPGRRDGITGLFSEVSGQRRLEGPAGPFDLTARADRIDVTAQGLIITDYKTGTPPSEREVAALLRPQLALEAAIAEAGGFAGLEAMPVTTLRYIAAKGGEPPGEERLIKAVPAALSAAAMDGLSMRIADFDRESTPYRAQRRSGFRYDFDSYAHLARVDEWSAAGGDDEPE